MRMGLRSMFTLAVVLTTGAACTGPSSSGDAGDTRTADAVADGEAPPPDGVAPDAGDDGLALDPTAPGPYWRVHFERNDGAFTLLSIERREFTAPRPPPLYGDVALVAWRGMTPVALAAARVPTELISEGYAIDTAQNSESTIPLEGAVSFSIDVPALEGIDRLTLEGPEHNVLWEQRAPFMSPPPGGRPVYADEGDAVVPADPGFYLLKPLGAYLLPAGLRMHAICGPSTVLDVDRDLAPSERMRLVTALRAIPPRVLAANRLAAVVRWPMHCIHDGNSIELASADGGAFVLNVAMLGAVPSVGNLLAPTVLHEAAHNLDFRLSRGDAERWQGFDDLSNFLVRRLAHWAGLSDGFRESWRSLHETGVEVGVAERWDAEFGGGCGDVNRRSAEQAVRAGFAVPYGACNTREDIASFAGAVRAERVAGTPSALCRALRAARTPPANDTLVPYTKVRMLESAGFIDAEDARACLGGYRLATAPGDGIHFLDAMGASTLRFGSNYVVGLQREYPAFVMAADNANAEYQFFVRVEAPGRRLPLGIHRLYDVVHPDAIPEGQNYALLANRVNDDRARVGAGGFVLFSQLSPTRVEGTFLFFSLRGPLGTITDQFPYVPFGFAP